MIVSSYEDEESMPGLVNRGYFSDRSSDSSDNEIDIEKCEPFEYLLDQTDMEQDMNEPTFLSSIYIFI